MNELKFNGKLKDKRAQVRLNPILNQAVDWFNNELLEEEQD